MPVPPDVLLSVNREDDHNGYFRQDQERHLRRAGACRVAKCSRALEATSHGAAFSSTDVAIRTVCRDTLSQPAAFGGTNGDLSTVCGNTFSHPVGDDHPRP